MLAIGVSIALLVSTTVNNLRTRGIPIGLDFLSAPSNVIVSESFFSHQPDDSYYRTIAVGIGNTLLVSFLVAILSTLFGLVVGLARLSSNPLVKATSRVWVEFARNFPPIVILIFIYSLWWKVFPPVDAAWQIAPGVYLSMRGLNLPSIHASVSPIILGLFLLGSLVLIVRSRISQLTGMSSTSLALVGVVTLSAAVLAMMPLSTIELPQFVDSNFSGGIELSPELATILIGLTVYTTGFVAEIIRGGVLSIDKGQWEAGRSLGLPNGKILQKIIVPQALRVIVPPLNSQYINVVKNSTLAIAVGYPDFLALMNTMISKSSHSVEGIAIIVVVYLCINLGLSTLANWYNRRIQIVGR